MEEAEGRQCSKCGEWKDLSRFEKPRRQCRDCRNALTREWARARYAADPEKARAAYRSRYHANIETYRETSRVWRENNREKQLGYQRRYAEANREARRIAAREWGRAHSDRRRAWSRANPDKRAAYTRKWALNNPSKVREKNRRHFHRRRLLVKEAFVEHVRLDALAERDGGKCGICGKKVALKDRSIDHIVPVTAGGEHSYRNTQLAHVRCNSRRNNRGPAQIRGI